MELSRSAVAVHAAIARWQRFNAQNRRRDADRVANDILDAHKPLLSSLAGKYATQEVPRDELIQAGRVALFGALERFDAGKETQFLTFATNCVQGAMLRYLRDNTGGAIHQPHYIRELRRKIERATATLEARGEEATAETIARELGRPVAEIERTIAFDTWVAHCPVRFGDGTCCGGIAVGADGCAQCAIDKSSDTDARLALDDAMMRHLDWEERTVLRLRYLEGRSQVDTATQIERCQMTVSRIEERALAKLRAKLTEDSL